jgi:hypothetical protein
MAKLGDIVLCELGMGGIPIQRVSREDAERILSCAVELGVNFFDTARGYGCSESYFSFLNCYHDRVVIATKSLSRTLSGLKSDFEKSMSELGLEYLDLFQLHNVASLTDWETIKKEGILDYLRLLQKEGRVRYLGVSGHKPWILRKILEEQEFSTVQFPFNYLEREAETELLPYLSNRKIIKVAMKPVGGGNIREIAANTRFILSSGLDIIIPGIDSELQIRQFREILNASRELKDTDHELLEREKERLGSEFCRRCEYCMPCPQGLPIAFLHVLRQYFYSYDLKEWALGRMRSLAKNYQDCIDCKQCLQKCPYEIDSGAIFKRVSGELLEELRK